MKKRSLLETLSLPLLSFFLLLPLLGYGFLSDDFPLIVANPRLQSWSLFFQNLLTPFFSFPTNPQLHYWRPATLLSYALELRLWGISPWGFHLTNILLHTANTLLLYLLLKRFRPEGPLPWTASLLFLLHPAHGENIAWISGRTDLLAFLFLALSLLFRLEYEERKRGLSISLLFFTLALLSKEAALLFLPLLFLLFPSKGLKNRLLLLLPYLSLLPLYLFLHQKAASTLALNRGLLWADIPLALRSAGAYVRILLFPNLPAPYFPMGELTVHPLLYTLSGLCGISLILLIIRFRREFPLTFPGLSLLLFLLPSLLPRFLPTWPPIAPRFAYLASPLAALFFTELALWAFKRGLRIPAFLLLLFLIFSWGTLLRLHLPFFRDDDTYIRTMSLRYPDEESFLFQLSFKEAQRGDLRKALLLVDKGLALSPSSPWVDYSRKGRTLRANILILLGREAEGEQEVERLLRATPSPEEGYSLHLLRAILLERRGDGEGALEELTLAGRLGKTPELLLRTARLQKRVGRGEEALRSLEEALNLGLDPKIAERERVEIQNRRESERE